MLTLCSPKFSDLILKGGLNTEVVVVKRNQLNALFYILTNISFSVQFCDSNCPLYLYVVPLQFGCLYIVVKIFSGHPTEKIPHQTKV